METNCDVMSVSLGHRVYRGINTQYAAFFHTSAQTVMVV